MTEYRMVVRMYHEQVADGTLSPQLAARLGALLEIVKAAQFWARARVWKRVRAFVDVMASTRGGDKSGVD